MLSESQGCAVLKESFQAAGYDIRDGYDFSEGVIRFQVDGFDPSQRVGFEYITTEAGDRSELSQEMIAAIEARIAHGELFILLVDEYDVGSEAELRQHAERFLSMVAAHRQRTKES
ncbi:MAG: hypothetical protein JNM40_21390 [Myxococcales bacterium]|nr:hypothetical protein [Myxococcales bacterium]